MILRQLITTPPIFNATQERYQIFRQKILELVDNAKILSIPAGFYQNFQKSWSYLKIFRSMPMILMQAVQKKVDYQNLGMLNILLKMFST